MKIFFLIGATFLLISGFYGCTKEVQDNSALCSNGVIDELAGETEIDCGGECDPCPPEATLSCVMKGNPAYGTPTAVDYVGEKVKCQVLGSGASLRVYCVNSSQRPLNFMFRPTEINVPLHVAASAFDFWGEPYIVADGDTGSIILTAHDTVRHIISGRFDFSGQRVTKSFVKCVVSQGVFADVRYYPENE